MLKRSLPFSGPVRNMNKECGENSEGQEASCAFFCSSHCPYENLS